MSADDLARLSLADKMVTTRAAAARARNAPQQPSHTPPSPSSSESSQLSPSPAPSVIESTSGIQYSVAALENDARRRAKQGLGDNDIKMKYCRLLDDRSNQYLFYLEDEIQVAMGGRYAVPRCTCGANEGGVACKHIFWMLDQLASKASQSIRDQTLELAVDGSSIQNKDPADIIKNATLERVADSLDWEFYEGPIPDDEDLQDEIGEMLSVFEPSEALPAEFKAPPNSFLSERSRKYREFKDLVSEMFTEQASKNLGLLNRLQAIIDSDFQAQVFFDKVNARIDRTFQALDEYIEHGSTGHDVPTCAVKLKECVQVVDDYYHQQERNGLDTPALALQAASALIRMMNGVVHRNFDAYANITWDFVPPDNPTDTNLFVCLIGVPAQNNELFVLDTLRKLPPDGIVRNHWEMLADTRTRLNPRWTPQPYLDAFQAFVSESRKRAPSASDGSTPSPKRPAV
ncbi:hypothetical protein M011DRAFT_397520 [Sporormia fimetaria CBS 119925]|uniref:SWIM-type domain-containing protein n=1 Tax=Sporormia fimetaria CBS 119925 TaxID=1340428 RepID=A0A6A6VIH8_9PLEO|nr:hypothetical protein M011DRAFT_397520 [Sporormia fimetaria CBS 119925]